MKDIRVISFLPTGRVIPRLTINLRNHRKILLIDGEQGFTGGMNGGQLPGAYRHH